MPGGLTLGFAMHPVNIIIVIIKVSTFALLS